MSGFTIHFFSQQVASHRYRSTQSELPLTSAMTPASNENTPNPVALDNSASVVRCHSDDPSECIVNGNGCNGDVNDAKLIAETVLKHAKFELKKRYTNACFCKRNLFVSCK
jgi:hypothetical protein